MEAASAFDVSAWLLKYAEGEKKHTSGRKRKTRRRRYIPAVTAYDIETSRVCTDANGNPQTIMYIWQMQLGLDVTIYGRYWAEFLDIARQVETVLYSLDKETGDDWRW